jgi:hypothetical protein
MAARLPSQKHEREPSVETSLGSASALYTFSEVWLSCAPVSAATSVYLDGGGLFGLRRLFRIKRLLHAWRRFCLRVEDTTKRLGSAVAHSKYAKAPPPMRRALNAE